jgi:hypothetical protein
LEIVRYEVIVHEQRKSGPLFLNRDRQKAPAGTAEIDSNPRFLFIEVEPQEFLVRVVAEGASNPRKRPHKMTLATSEDALPGIALDEPVVGGSATHRAGPPCPTIRVDQARRLLGGPVEKGPQQAATDQHLRIRIIESGRKKRSARDDWIHARLFEWLEEANQTLPEPEDGKGIEPDVLDSQEGLARLRSQRRGPIPDRRGNHPGPRLGARGVVGPQFLKESEPLRGDPLRGRLPAQPAGNFGKGGHLDSGWPARYPARDLFTRRVLKCVLAID